MAKREEVIECANKMAALLQEEEFGKSFRAKVTEAGILFANQLFDALEEDQIAAINSWGMSESGEKMLTHLKMAMKSFPNDQEVKIALMGLVTAEETLLDAVQKELAQKHGLPQGDPNNQFTPNGPSAGGAHGHSHDGGAHGHSHAPGAHGHSHGGAPGAHGHSHNGVPCTGHGHSHGGPGGMNPQQMAQMQAAMNTLSEQQKKDMQTLQMKMMSGQQPSQEDQRKMMGIQQHLAAYMATMQAAVQNAQKAQLKK